MRTRAVDNGPDDGWRGARIGAERRDREARSYRAFDVEVDLGQPRVPAIVSIFLAAAVAVTVWEFERFGVSPTPSELARAGGASLGAIATGEWWKLIVANLLHGDLTHLALNAFFTYLVGRQLEHVSGHVVVLATITWSALLASAFSIVLGGGAVSVGASGVTYGLMGCALAIDPRGRTELGTLIRPLLIVGAIYTFVAPNVSIGGHLGGLVAGLLVGGACWGRASTSDHPIGRPRRALALGMLAVTLPVIALLTAGPSVLPDQARNVRSQIVAPLLERELSGVELTSGIEVGDARCGATSEPTVYRCSARFDGDREDVDLRFRAGIDRWSIRPSAAGP